VSGLGGRDMHEAHRGGRVLRAVDGLADVRLGGDILVGKNPEARSLKPSPPYHRHLFVQRARNRERAPPDVDVALQSNRAPTSNARSPVPWLAPPDRSSRAMMQAR